MILRILRAKPATQAPWKALNTQKRYLVPIGSLSAPFRTPNSANPTQTLKDRSNANHSSPTDQRLKPSLDTLQTYPIGQKTVQFLQLQRKFSSETPKHPKRAKKVTKRKQRPRARSKAKEGLSSFIPEIRLPSDQEYRTQINQRAHIASQELKYESYNKARLEPAFYLPKSNLPLPDKINSSTNLVKLLKVYEANKFAMEPFSATLVVQKMAGTIKDYFGSMKHILRDKRRSNVKNLPKITKIDSKISHVFEFVEAHQDEFTTQDLLLLTKSLSQINEFVDCRPLIEILMLTFFRKNSAEIEVLETSSLVQMLESYHRAGLSNQTLIGYLAVEWNRRIKRFRDLGENMLKVPRKLRIRSFRRQIKQHEVENKKSHYLMDVETVLDFLVLLVKLGVDDPENVTFLRRNMEQIGVVEFLSIPQASKLIFGMLDVPELRSPKMVEMVANCLESRAEELSKTQGDAQNGQNSQKSAKSGLADEIILGRIVTGLIKLRRIDDTLITKYMNLMVQSSLQTESQSPEAENEKWVKCKPSTLSAFINVLYESSKTDLALPKRFSKRLNKLVSNSHNLKVVELRKLVELVVGVVQNQRKCREQGAVSWINQNDVTKFCLLLVKRRAPITCSYSKQLLKRNRGLIGEVNSMINEIL